MTVAYDFFFPGASGEEVSKTGFLCVTASILIEQLRKVIYTDVVEATVYVSLYMLLLQVCPRADPQTHTNMPSCVNLEVEAV